MTKEQYEEFRLMLKGCGAGLPMYSTLNRFERVWFSSIIEILTEKDKQIEKMKCCQNCKHCAKIHDYDLDNEEDSNLEYCEVRCHERSGWELKE